MFRNANSNFSTFHPSKLNLKFLCGRCREAGGDCGDAWWWAALLWDSSSRQRPLQHCACAASLGVWTCPVDSDRNTLGSQRRGRMSSRQSGQITLVRLFHLNCARECSDISKLNLKLQISVLYCVLRVHWRLQLGMFWRTNCHWHSLTARYICSWHCLLCTSKWRCKYELVGVLWHVNTR